MDFIAIDFETANESRASPCAVAAIVCRQDGTSDTFYSLIKPKDCRFNHYNTSIHGIEPADVIDKPEFPELWPRLRNFLETQVVLAHNASFDMSVLRSTLMEYRLSFPELRYGCTWAIAKSVWPGLISYRLPMVARMLDIQFEHHHALEDARACAEIAARACKERDAKNMYELADHLGICFGEIHSTGDYVPPGGSSASRREPNNRIDVRAIEAASDCQDSSHPFFGRYIAFTGTLKTMNRKQAMQIVVEFGAQLENGVTKRTNFLIVGDQDLRMLADGQTKSSKMRKAETLLKKGHEIEIIAEEDFLQMLGM